MQDEKVKLAKSSAEFIDEVRELRHLEDEKRKEPISTPTYHELAEAVTDKSRDIMQHAVLQEDLGNEADTGDLSIEDISRNGTGET